MVTGLLHDAGYFAGDDLWEPTPANPTGFFESRTINDLNERLISQVVPARPRLVVGGRDLLGSGRARRLPMLNAMPGPRQRWLAVVPEQARTPSASQADAAIIRDLVARETWVYKDPRFSFTLPAWRPFLPADALYICTIRDPGSVIASIHKEVRTAPYLQNLRMTAAWAIEVWKQRYGRILQHVSAGGDWLFLHYEQLLDGSGITRLESTVGIEVDRTRVQQSLRRSVALPVSDQRAMALYDRLCDLAEFSKATA